MILQALSMDNITNSKQLLYILLANFEQMCLIKFAYILCFIIQLYYVYIDIIGLLSRYQYWSLKKTTNNCDD